MLFRRGLLYADNLYRYMCSYAHSGSLSVLQVRQAMANRDQQDLAENTIRTINVMLAFMVRAYCSLFPKAKAAVSNDEQLVIAVNEWAQLGAEE